MSYEPSKQDLELMLERLLKNCETEILLFGAQPVLEALFGQAVSALAKGPYPHLFLSSDSHINIYVSDDAAIRYVPVQKFVKVCAHVSTRSPSNSFSIL